MCEQGAGGARPRIASPPRRRCATRSTSTCGPRAARRATATSPTRWRRSSTPSGSACARSSKAALFRLAGGRERAARGARLPRSARRPRTTRGAARTGHLALAQLVIDGVAHTRRRSVVQPNARRRCGSAPPPMTHTPSALRSLPGVLAHPACARARRCRRPRSELLEPLESPSWVPRIWRGQPWLVVGAFASSSWPRRRWWRCIVRADAGAGAGAAAAGGHRAPAAPRAADDRR